MPKFKLPIDVNVLSRDVVACVFALKGSYAMNDTKSYTCERQRTKVGVGKQNDERFVRVTQVYMMRSK